MSATVRPMTPRDRVLAAVRREPVDYVPCAPFFSHLTEVQRRGKPWNYPWKPDEDSRDYLINVLGVDPVVEIGWWDGAYCPADGVTAGVWKEGEVLHKTYETPSGELHAAVEASELWPFGDNIPLYHDFVGHYREPWLQTEADLECLRHVILPPRTDAQVEAARAVVRERKALADSLNLPTMASIGLGLTAALMACGAEQICTMVIDNPDLVDGFLELEHQCSVRLMEIASEAGVDIIRRNGFYETGDFYSPAMLERFLGNRLRAEVEAIHAGGALAAYTVHSGIMPMLDYLDGIDFDCIIHLDIGFEDIDAHAVDAKLGARKSFWTGPSSTFHMYARDPEDVRQAVRNVFAAFGKTGLLLAAVSSTHPMMPWENTLAMIDEWRKLR